MEFNFCSEVLELSHGINFMLCEFKEARLHNVTQIVDVLIEELTLLQIESESKLFRQLQNAPYLRNVILSHSKTKKMTSRYTGAGCHCTNGQGDVHHPPKGPWGIIQPKISFLWICTVFVAQKRLPCRGRFRRFLFVGTLNSRSVLKTLSAFWSYRYICPDKRGGTIHECLRR